MADLMGVHWNFAGMCLNHSPRYDLLEVVNTFEAPNTPSSNEKPPNPKDMNATNKVPFHLWPETASAYGALAMAEGAMKYGRSNWRHSGAKASMYYDAARRHLNDWFEGKDIDESGAPNLGGVLACVAILVDATEAGKLHDDRMYPGGYHGLTSRVESIVAQMRERHADKNPQHYSQSLIVYETDSGFFIFVTEPARSERVAKFGSSSKAFAFGSVVSFEFPGVDAAHRLPSIVKSL
jgi:hypothetical protein